MQDRLLFILMPENDLIKELIPFQFLSWLSLVFLFLIIGLLLFILGFLYHRQRQGKLKNYLSGLYSDWISEIALCETSEELEAVFAQSNVETIRAKWLNRTFARKILLHELVNAHKSIAGKGAENIRWLYEKTQLYIESLQSLSSRKWYIKAIAIQQLAQMGQEKYLTKIYKETNSRNLQLRNEAQLGIVKLTGFKGLRFLNVINKPLTEWQQLCLLHELKVDENYDPEKIRKWITSQNDTVATFALRLVKHFMCFELHDAVVGSLHHVYPSVRMQAIETLQEIAGEQTAGMLKLIFKDLQSGEKIKILELLGKLEPDGLLPFYEDLMMHHDKSVQHAAADFLINQKKGPSYVKLQAKNSIL